MNFFGRTKKNNRFTLALSLALAMSVSLIVTSLVSASGPAFNVFPVAYDGSQNSDYPLIDVRNVTAGGSFSTSQSTHSAGVTANPGDTLEFLIYYHNGVADAPENTAHNTRISANLPSGSSTAFSVSATISADSATSVSSSDSNRGGNATISVNNSAQSLQYVNGSTQWYPNRATTPQSMQDGITSGGVLLGDIRGCWNFSGFVKFRATVSGTVTQPTISITKQVSNVTTGTGYASSTNASPSDSVKFQIIVSASGGTVNNLVIRDIVPSTLVYTSNTTQVNGSSVSDSSGLLGSGYTFGNLAAGQQVTVVFQAQVAGASIFNGSNQTITNTANARGDNTATQQATATVQVGTVQGSSFQLSKSAYNQTQATNAQSVMANAGDIINYTLTYKNTGSAQISNVVIQDDLSNVLNLADMVNNGGGTMNGNTIVFPAISVPAGVSIDKTFQVKVRDVSANQSGLQMVNVYGNTVTISIRSPQVQGTAIVYRAPRTGPGENLAVVFASLITVGLYIFIKRPRIIFGS